VIPDSDEIAVARVVPDHWIGSQLRRVGDYPLEVDDVLANRETPTHEEAEAVPPRGPMIRAIRWLDGIEYQDGRGQVVEQVTSRQPAGQPPNRAG